MNMIPWKVEELVPHKASMSLLDEAVAADDESARAAVQIAESSLLFDAGIGGVPASAGIEYMAQTVAMFAGAQARRRGEAPAVGFLLGTRRFVAHEPVFILGARLDVFVEQELRDDQMAAFSCKILEGEALLAEARLSVFQPHDIEMFLKAGGNE
ncbi:MAG TPA: 3-hydroxylacyl-ACP dehydratase [Rhodobiaceae bacterium]|nr:3-hydroxylacyl-ACP dehydratase [Rhodobiaceae bacterium]|tara:strand:+ start:3531 stop:3995 length:465 start_codon:yes stop_codon:yes gene_type:complete